MKILFMQRKGLETMIYDFMKAQGITREAAVQEINELIKQAEPEAEVAIFEEEFSTKNVGFKQ